MNEKSAEEMNLALKKVWDICGTTQECEGCPALDENGICTQYESAPYSWKIQSESRDRWKTKKTWREKFLEKQEKVS